MIRISDGHSARGRNLTTTDEVTNTSRRKFLAQVAAGSVLVLAGRAHTGTFPVMTVWKDPNCGCCGGWVAHIRRNDFTVTVIETPDLQTLKAQRNVPAGLASCHTAEIGGYTIEGHVPAAAITRLIAEKPAGRGLAVPGMPIGSPGMEGGRPETYDVILFGEGASKLFGRFLGEKPV